MQSPGLAIQGNNTRVLSTNRLQDSRSYTMSYNDDRREYGGGDERREYGQGGGYGGRDDRREDYGRPQEGGFGGPALGDDERRGGGGGYGSSGGYGGDDRRQEHGRPQEGGFGGPALGDDERRGGGGSYGGGDDDRRGGGGYGGGERREEYSERRHEGGGYGGDGRRQESQGYGDRPSGGYSVDDSNDRPSGGYGGGSGQYEGHHSSGTSYGGGGGYGGASDDFSGAAHHASSESGESGDSNMFGSVLGMLSGKKDQLKNENVDEDDAVRQHEKFYGNGANGGNEQASSNNVGSAAAMQAMKMFNGSSNEDAKGGQNKFIGMAMGQAAQLFDKQQSQGKTVSIYMSRVFDNMTDVTRILELQSKMPSHRLLRWRSRCT
jgi:hypothetical protein